MSQPAPMKELYLGCECMDLNHVALFMHFPLTDEETKKLEAKNFPNLEARNIPLPEEDDDLNIIYLALSMRNYFDAIIPPIFNFYDKWAWHSFLYHSWGKRLWIAGKYIANPSYQRQFGILDAFDFQNKDLEQMDAFLSLISSAIDDNSFSISEVWLDNDDWLIKIEPTRIEFKKHDWMGDWQIGWEPQFKSRGFFGRVKYAFKYIFGKHSIEKHFTITEKDAAKIRGMIKWVQETNRKDEKK